MKNKNVFPCYSIPLRDYLVSHGVRYELVGLNPNTNNMFWIFILTEQVKDLLEKWSK